MSTTDIPENNDTGPLLGLGSSAVLGPNAQAVVLEGVAEIRRALAQYMKTHEAMREALEVTRGNIASLAAAGRCTTYEEWVRTIDQALVYADFAKPHELPLDMVLHCPACGLQHIDAREPPMSAEFDDAEAWSNPPHRSHLCHGCGHIWRPADVATNGVQSVKTKGAADSADPVPREAFARDHMQRASLVALVDENDQLRAALIAIKAWDCEPAQCLSLPLDLRRRMLEVLGHNVNSQTPAVR